MTPIQQRLQTKIKLEYNSSFFIFFFFWSGEHEIKTDIFIMYFLMY